MRLAALLAASAALVSAPCAAGYNEIRIGKSGGYQDKQLAPNSWKIRATARVQWESNPDFATDMALFRGAVRSKAAGYAFMHVVNFSIVDQQMYGRTMRQEVRLTVTATNNPAEPLRCQAKRRWFVNCRVLDVDELLRVKGPAMLLTREDIEQEVARAKAAPATGK